MHGDSRSNTSQRCRKATAARAKTVAASKAAKAKAKANVKAAAVKSKSAPKTKGKAKAHAGKDANPYELPPDQDQARLNAFWPSTTRRPGQVPTPDSEKDVAPAPDSEKEAAAVVEPRTHEAETMPGTIGLEAASNVEKELSKDNDCTQRIEATSIDSALNPNPNDATVEALPKEELPLATVSTAEADSAQNIHWPPLLQVMWPLLLSLVAMLLRRLAMLQVGPKTQRVKMERF